MQAVSDSENKQNDTGTGRIHVRYCFRSEYGLLHHTIRFGYTKTMYDCYTIQQVPISMTTNGRIVLA